jgi:hypothetical protein
MRKAQALQPTEFVRIKGFVRLKVVDVRGPRKGRVQLREVHNVITANGLQHYIVGAIGAVAGSKQISYLQLATQTTAPSSAQTSASGEFEARKTTTNTFVANGTLRMVASYATNEATQSTIGGLAAYNTSAAGTAASVATFATSNKTTDQTLSVTYEYRFA